jgi:hypothetical protein
MVDSTKHYVIRSLNKVKYKAEMIITFLCQLVHLSILSNYNQGGEHSVEKKISESISIQKKNQPNFL